jgi:group I intron endonuclease
MPTGVYMIVNKLDGKTYVGKSWDSFSSRKSSHWHYGVKGKDGGCRYLYNAMKCHGVDNFEFIILHVITRETHGENFMQVILETEIKEQIERNTLAPNGYNLVIGDPSSKNGIVAMSDETRHLKSEVMKGPNNPMFGRFGELNHFFGKKHTQETREANSRRREGVSTGPHSEEWNANISSALTGRRLTEEHCKNLSVAKIGLTVGEKNGMFGRHRTDAEKKAISDAHSKSVEQWAKDGSTRISVFPSVREASNQTGANSSTIGRSANGNPKCKTAGGFIWKWANSDKEDDEVPDYEERLKDTATV